VNRPTIPLGLRVAAAALAGVLALTVTGPPAGAQAPDGDPEAATPAAEADRVLVLSVPGLTWEDVAEHDLPNLERLLADSALANLAPRGVFARSGPGDAYLTLSAGSRATTFDDIDGQVLALDEVSSGSTAGDIFRRRTGQEPDGPFVSLTWPTLERANAAQPFETEMGLLTDTLTEAGVSAAAIGNADGVDSVADSYERQAGLALADGSGVVPAGFLGKELLLEDPEAPFGLRLDADAVLAQFKSAWRDAEPTAPDDEGGVVLVEASDLARTLRYRPIVDSDRYDEMWDTSLAQTDALVGQLLESVDPERDTVLLVAPYNRKGDRDLVAAALRGPGIEPGYLRSASTQRSGYLTLVDIAPTILDRFGIDRPVEMEGRPAVAVDSTDDFDARVDHLVTQNEAARFRENLLTPTTTLVVLLFALVLALAIAAHANRWGSAARRTIWLVALADLAILPASYLARAFPLESLGTGFYWAFVLGVAAIVPLIAWATVGRRSPRLVLVVVLALMAGVLMIDVMTGSNLSLNSAFGYSATGNSRLYGISNYSYGQLAAAACLLAAWLASVRPGRVGQAMGIGAMLVTLIVLGVPIWGSDVGGVLAFTPAVAVFAVKVTDRRIKVRTLVVGGVATAVAIGLFGLLDLARAPANRGHLGRLFERMGAEGPAPVLSMIERKLAANLEVSTSSQWVLAIPLAIAFWMFLRRSRTRPYPALVARFLTLPSGLGAVVVAGVLGSALNDSGAIIGGIVSMVVATSLAVLLLEGDAPPTTEEAPDPAPAEPERATVHAATAAAR
jgi:hypothetical protein